MKKKTLAEMRGKSLVELRSLIVQKQQEAAHAVVDIRLKTAKNVHSVWAIRRDIAQLKTLMREKEQEA